MTKREYQTAWQRADYEKYPEKYKSAQRRHRVLHPPKSKAMIGPHRRPGRGLQEFCMHGHALTPDNLYAYTSAQNEFVRQCKQCMTDKNHTRHQQLRENHLNRNFNITQARYDELLAEQNGGCKICGTKEPGGMGAFHIDHDHSCCPGKKCCGKCIRGLLCRRCNDTLGKVSDSIELLQAMIQYLEKFKCEAKTNVIASGANSTMSGSKVG
jgi:hypothetical protein